MIATSTSILTEEWAIRDDVIRLREWGTNRTYPLYSDHADPVIGTAPGCQIRVPDRTRRVSRQHAQFQLVDRRWVVLDRSKNGLYRNGAKLDKFVLTPGVELGLGSGGVTLVAESARLIALRSTLARMLGWSASAAEAVDLALRAIRFAAQRRTPLVLCGADLVPLAEELHRLTLTATRPFVLCNSHRSTTETTWNPTRCAATGTAALAEAVGGTVCLMTRYLPSDLRSLMQAFRRPECQTQIVVCSERVVEAEVFNAAPIVVPPLASRKDELDRLIEEYARDAAGPLELGPHWLSTPERTWIKANMHTLALIQKATIRLAAIRQAGSMSRGAKRLGISHVGMLKWLRTHKFPLGLTDP